MLPEKVDIIIPTYDNHDQLMQCVSSMLLTRNACPLHIIIVNNGQARIYNEMFQSEYVTVIDTGENLGWTGGLKLGLEHSKSKYVMFANDDVFIPRSSGSWLRDMVRTIDNNDRFGAVGPSSNVVMGSQNIWKMNICRQEEVTFLIGFCMLLNRRALDDAGGVHDMEYGGDDLDLSIRLRKAGYALINCCDVFVYHHGFQTGNRVYGTPDKPNGWNSREMTDNTNMELIRKHGFIAWWETMVGLLPDIGPSNADTEGDMVRGMIVGEDVLEVGCGGTKTVSRAVGVDIVPAGEEIPIIGAVSVADVTAEATNIPLQDATQDTIIARHIIEHLIDPITAIAEWKRLLRPGGRIIISCPDERVLDGVPLNPQHLHAFTVASIRTILYMLNLSVVDMAENYNGVSFTICAEKAK
jgi:GT2 family glycosyltransferase/SAM-dependent methyltransferase